MNLIRRLESINIAKCIYPVRLTRGLTIVVCALSGKHCIFQGTECFVASLPWYKQTNEERQHNSELQRQRRHFSKPRHKPKRHRVKGQGQRIESLDIIQQQIPHPHQ